MACSWHLPALPSIVQNNLFQSPLRTAAENKDKPNRLLDSEVDSGWYPAIFTLGDWIVVLQKKLLKLFHIFITCRYGTVLASRRAWPA